MSRFKRFLSYYKPHTILFFSDLLCALLVSAVDLAFPQVLRYVSNTLIFEAAPQLLRQALVLLAVLLFMYILRYFAQYFITSWGHIMGARMESTMRRDLFYHMQRLSFSYYDKNNTGELLSKLVADLFDIAELAHHGPENLFISVLKILGSFGFLLLLNIPMTLILLFLTGIMLGFTVIQNSRMRSVFMENRQKIAAINVQVQDSLSGIRAVKAFGNETLEQEKFDLSNQRFLGSKERSYKVMGQFFAGNSFLEGLLYVSVLGLGIYFISQGSLKPADLAIYALYLGIFLNPIQVLLNFSETLQKGRAGFSRFCEVLESEPEVLNVPGAQKLADFKGTLRFEGVSFDYDSKSGILRDIDLEIPTGKTLALVGPSGGGKTTLCSLIPRFYEVQAGRITLDGLDLRKLELRQLRKHIGIVQQEVYMFGGSLRENIAYGKPGASFKEIEEAARKACIHDFIVSLPEGYDSLVGERGVRLSGGQKQRLSLARVFLKDPPVLILDEASSALDKESEQLIQKSLETLAQSRTCLVIAHRLSTIRRADEILVLSEGRIQERGTHESLMALGGRYAHFNQLDGEGNA